MIPIGALLAGPARLIIACLGLALAAALPLAWGMWWRAEAHQARAQAQAERVQSQVLSAALEKCNAGVAKARRAADEAISATAKRLAEARRLAAARAMEIERIERLLASAVPARADGAPAGCDEAWVQIERTTWAPK